MSTIMQSVLKVKQRGVGVGVTTESNEQNYTYVKELSGN